MAKLPIGIQSFEKLRAGNFQYVDKTAFIYQLAHDDVPYFLSRPRRFGKSLLVSTLKAYWEGKSELFSGLAIESLEKEHSDAWQPHPVFHFDFDGNSYLNESIEKVLDGMLSDWEAIYGSEYQKRTLGDRFEKLLELSCKQAGNRAVILIDEYDKPLLDTVADPETQNHIKEVFKGFFSRLKKADEFIQFIFITGVTKFHKVSIFSDLNHLTDISTEEDFAAVCGITESELREYFMSEIKEMAIRRVLDTENCLTQLRAMYDGYHFHPYGTPVYNPYSLLTALRKREFGSYWYETGTPTFLIQSLRKSNFDLRKLTDRTLYASEATIKDYTGDSLDVVPLLYQTGYLTIADFDPSRARYVLSFPNEEVKYAFIESLIPSYVPAATAGNGLDIYTLDEYIENAQLDRIRDVLTSLFANIVYTEKATPFEHYFQTVIYLVFTLLGKFVICEMHTFNGRIDCKIETRDYVYLFEFKRDDTAEAALRQIDSKEYTLPFIADPRRLFKIGVSFDSETRRLVEWKVEEN